ncbi:MAG: hypothetical protein KAJ46_01115 [Sedimentisphaerales bacterium]|nr:hypothetical protein [Sedimentisphaerales bacterium]
MDLVPRELAEIDQRRILILYHTDHNALLKKCRKLMEEIKLDDIVTKPLDAPDPQLKKFKHYRKKILNLNPTFVYVYPNMVNIEMCVTSFSVSISAFPENVEGWGDKKLLNGLWYNDKGYSMVSNFEKYLQSLKPK